MSDWAVKRFWKAATVESLPEGDFEVRLDGRMLRTPSKAQLRIPTRALAEAIATEWMAQNEKIDPRTMPMTRTANSALDKVALQAGDVANLLAAYGESDLLCYRASAPEALVARQAAQWDPLLDWAKEHLGAPLAIGTGVMHVAQPGESTTRLANRVHALTAWELAAFHDLVALSGSLVIGLAAIDEHAPLETLWQISRLDELWQIECWGNDDEAEALAELKTQAFLDAGKFYQLVTLTD